MKPEHAEYLKKMQSPNWYGEQDENGIDLGIIRENLRLSIEERLAKASCGRRSVLENQRIGKYSPQERTGAGR